MAIIVYSHDLGMFAKDTSISLNKINSVEFKPATEGVIVYNRPMNKKEAQTSKSFRVGIKFFNQIDNKKIHELSLA